MAFIENPQNDPVLRRGERLGRYGSLLPVMGTFAVIFSTDLVRYTKSEYLAAVLCLAAIGQTVTWVGMLSLKRSAGWDSGIIFYLWAGAFVTTIALYGTVVSLFGLRLFLPALIPWIAPITASVAKRRMAVRSQAESRS
ncbi:hypothetical protein [Streptantibioticus silvisoli]|uniref:Uncharacterized protein n=1 Tax=Streptantibioticus silvisoli TaxID=2705255 RepID=A0ABT6W2W0_9ACTN|nr:hypothetical protein [Streptantibioticus silvisoli]MDI5965071.1 hypothetical protein [Streptantibioticus silvisoli]